MHIETLKELIEEAKKNAKAAEKEFNKYDNSEDLQEMEAWEFAIAWLTAKLTQG